MIRKSTSSFRVRSASPEQISFTGLRPSWGAFWEVEAESSTLGRQERVPADQSSTITGTMRSSSGKKNVKFVTGSEWSGEWDSFGMCGIGVLRMPHGVIYEGMMVGGLFEGLGNLRYPNGGTIEGFWHEGKLKYCHYVYANSLRRESTVHWRYCKMPDRRFYSEKQRGLTAADTEQRSAEHLSIPLPPGMYDTGDGFYSPKTKCVVDRFTGEVLRIPTVEQEKWILDNCRVGVSENVPGVVGFRPDLYENWYTADDFGTSVEEGQMSRSNFHKVLEDFFSQMDSEIDTDSITTSGEGGRGTMNAFTLRNINSILSAMSMSTMDFEMHFSNYFNGTDMKRVEDHSQDLKHSSAGLSEIEKIIMKETRNFNALKKPSMDKSLKEKSDETNLSSVHTGIIDPTRPTLLTAAQNLSDKVPQNLTEISHLERPSAVDYFDYRGDCYIDQLEYKHGLIEEL